MEENRSHGIAILSIYFPSMKLEGFRYVYVGVYEGLDSKEKRRNGSVTEISISVTRVHFPLGDVA